MKILNLKILNLKIVIYEDGSIDFKDNDFYAKDIITFSKPENIVVIGTFNLLSTHVPVSEDFSYFNITIDGIKLKKDKYHLCDGFISIMNVKDYQDWYSKHNNEFTNSIYSFMLPNFTGAIQVGAKVENSNEYIKNIHFNNYIKYQSSLDCETFINLPKGTIVLEMEDRNKLPIKKIREMNINSVTNNNIYETIKPSSKSYFHLLKISLNIIIGLINYLTNGIYYKLK